MLRVNQLPPPSVPLFLQVSNSKHGTRRSRLLSIAQSVATRVASFNQARPDVDTISIHNWSTQQESDLVHCYKTPTIPLNKLKRQIKENQPFFGSEVCPYCGLSSVETWDHYLPQSSFPEFSVFQDNLIPSCHKCNEIKGDREVNNGIRNILYPYIEYLPRDQQLFAADYVKGNRPCLKYRLLTTSSLAASMHQRITTHVQRLRLLQRYEAESISIISEVKRIYAEHPSLNQSVFADTFNRTALNYAEDYGLSYWKVAAYKAFADSIADFLDDLARL